MHWPTGTLVASTPRDGSRSSPRTFWRNNSKSCWSKEAGSTTKSRNSAGRGRKAWSSHCHPQRSPKGLTWLDRGDAKTFVEEGGTSEGASVSRTGTAKKLPETPPSTRTRAPVQLSEGDKKEDCYKVRHPILRVSITQREIEKDGFRRNTGLWDGLLERRSLVRKYFWPNCPGLTRWVSRGVDMSIEVGQPTTELRLGMLPKYLATLPAIRESISLTLHRTVGALTFAAEECVSSR